MRSLVLFVLAACASAGSGGSADSTNGDDPAADARPPVDARPAVDARPPVDAVPVDAIPQPTTLSQTPSTVPNSTRLGCNQGGYTLENSYYRVFPLADFGILGSYEVRSVTFAINLANAGGSQQPAQVKIGRYNATPGGVSLSLADVVPINAVSIQIPDGATSITTPITGVVPPGGNLIVELAVPEGLGAQNVLWIGTNAAGESRPGYIRAPAQGCDIVVPTSMNVIASQKGVAKVDLIMTVSGVRY